MTAVPVKHGRRQPGHNELAELKLPKLTWKDKGQNTVYGIAGLHAGVFIMTFFYIAVLQGTYRFPWDPGTVWSLGPSWDNLPVTLGVTSWLNWIPVPHTGGLGSWIVNNWDPIQHLYFFKIPAFVIGWTFVGLLLGLGAGKPLGKPKGVDKFFIKMNDLFRIFPNRYQGYTTTTVQYAFLPVSGLAASLPGVIVSSVLIFGGTALLHSLGVNPFGSGLLEFSGFNSLRAVLAGSVWPSIVIGAAGQHFFARYVTLKSGEDSQQYFLENRANEAYESGDIMQRKESGQITEQQAINELSRQPRATPGKLYPNIYRYRLAEILRQRIVCVRHGNEARIVVPFILAVLTFATIVGGYWYVYGPKHGMLLP